MPKHLYYFRPGEERRMLARCQFGINAEGGCGAYLTYPIEGYPWRKNVSKGYEFTLSAEVQTMLFAEVARLKVEHPEECLGQDDLWSDTSEKANGITRDRKTDTLCYTIGVQADNGHWLHHFSIRENSKALIDSPLFQTISKLIQPYETLS